MRVIGRKITTFEDSNEAIQSIKKLMGTPKVKNVSFVNAHACNLIEKNIEFKNAIYDSTLLLRDGIGVKIMLKLYGFAPGFNANGTDLIPQLLKEVHNKRIFIIGTSDEIITYAATMLKFDNINIVGYMNGFATFNSMLERLQADNPDIVILGMGMPKQELFSHYLKKFYANDLLIINGGAIFDFMTENVSRAPLFMRRAGLEWLYRLFCEPKRLFGRYVLGIPIFFIRLTFSSFLKNKN